MQLNYKLLGNSGPSIVILHGLFGMLDNWQTIGRWLAEDFRVYLVDQRNHGRSPHSPDLSYPLMALDLAEFLNDMSLESTSVLGHSMGGKTAIQFALDYPDKVDGLIVADMGMKAFPSGHDKIFEALFSLDVAKISSRTEAEDQLKPLVPEFGVRQFLLKNLSRSKEGGYRWKMNLPAIQSNYDNILAAIDPFADDKLAQDRGADDKLAARQHAKSYDGKSLFIRGTRSDYVTDEDWPEIQEYFPLAQLVGVDAGHWLHAEKPKEFYQLVKKFCQEL